MKKVVHDLYRGWNITVKAGRNKQSKYSCDITDPSGHTQKIRMGGDNYKRALERAWEMIDKEYDFGPDD